MRVYHYISPDGSLNASVITDGSDDHDKVLITEDPRGTVVKLYEAGFNFKVGEVCYDTDLINFGENRGFTVNVYKEENSFTRDPGGSNIPTIIVVDNLNSQSSTDALAARQGMLLNGRLLVLESQTAINTSDIEGLRNDFNNEKHFQGAYATNAEVQALPGIQGGFAWSYESDTVWIYNSAASMWVNSGVAIPSDSPLASDTTPLSDGEASAGIAAEYSRGDHRHPTDPTLAKLIDLNSYLPLTGGILTGPLRVNNNVTIAFGGAIAGVDSTGVNHVMLARKRYLAQDGVTWVEYLEVNAAGSHLQFNTNDDAEYGTNMTCDTPNGKEILPYFSNLPQEVQFPADSAQVERTATDVQINSKKAVLNGRVYEESDENIVVPSADPTHAGAYPADHYNKVQNLPANTNAELSNKAPLVNSVIPFQYLPPSLNNNIIQGTAQGVVTNEETGIVTATGFNDTAGNAVTPDPNLQYFGQVTNLTFVYNSLSNLFVARATKPLALGETSSTAYPGDKGKIAYDYVLAHQNVENTSDANKPISNAAAAAFAGKEPSITPGNANQYWNGNKTWVNFPTIPTSLPTPNQLTFTGSSTGVFNGSTALTVNIPVLTQVMQQTSFTLTNGITIQIISYTATRLAIYDIGFTTGIVATPTGILTALTSAACFAQYTLTFRVNGTLSGLAETHLVARGPSNVASRVNHRTVIQLNPGDVLSVAITANEAGMSIPVNGNTRLTVLG